MRHTTVCALLPGLLLATLLGGCPPVGTSDPNAPGSGGGDPLAGVPADAIDARVIDSSGGVLEAPDPLSSTRTMQIVIPAGAVPAGAEVGFYVRQLNSLGAREFESEPVDIYDAAVQLGTPRDGVITHPLYGALVQRNYARWHVGPTLELGPAGMTFAQPIEIRIPFEAGRWDPEELALATMFTGDYDDADALISGPRIMDVEVDMEASVLIARVEHFSIFQGALNILTETGSRVISLIQRAATDLPPAPDITDEIAERIVCSGIKPRVVFEKMPEPLVLLWYLANPADAPSRVVDPNGHIEAREFWERAEVVTGLEVPLEDWVISQPDKSVAMADLFGEAYERTNGDVFQALLLCHNVLRGFDGANRNLDVRGQTLQRRMANFRNDGGDEVGGRYHYFGMASFGFILRAVSSFVEDRSRGIVQVPGLDIDEDLTGFIIQFEECLVSGDCITDDVEYAIDINGRDLGFELADQLFDDFNDYQGSSLEVEGAFLSAVSERFGVESSCGLEVEASAASTTVFAGDTVNFHAEVTGGVPPYGVGWEQNGELITTGTDPVIIFNEIGTYTIKVVASDELNRRAYDTVQIDVIDAATIGYRVYRVTNYNADGGYITVLDTDSETSPPRLSSFPGGGIGDTLAEITPISEVYANRDDAAASVCARVCCYYRPVLASFIQMGQFDGQDAGISNVIKSQCPE